VDNPDQADCDGDHVGDACDPESPVPDEILGVEFKTKQMLTWDGAFVSKNIYRGSVMSGAPWEYNHELIGTVSSFGSTFVDSTVPVSQEVLYYLVVGFNGCGEGL
jgi:hypothetical protein